MGGGIIRTKRKVGFLCIRVHVTASFGHCRGECDWTKIGNVILNVLTSNIGKKILSTMGLIAIEGDNVVHQARSKQLHNEQMNNALQVSFSMCVMNGMAKNVH